MTPTARTLQHLRQLGYLADVVERRKGPVTVDLFGIIDVVAIHPDFGTLGVQCTTGSNAAARCHKLRGAVASHRWIAVGNLLEVWSWRKLKVKRGGKAVRWEVDRREIT